MKPRINVTPLIDVLLVLLIIFMVVSPAKPSKFDARIPTPPRDQRPARADPRTLVVSLLEDNRLEVNNTPDLGTADDPSKAIALLMNIFDARRAAADGESGGDSAETTVFIRAPRAVEYGSVVKVIDAVKRSGAAPISLMIDDPK